MARTKRNSMRHEEARKKIQTTQLINRLQNHALGELDPPMDMTQIRAAESLLKKAVPDLQSVALTDPEGDALTVKILKFSDQPEDDDGDNGE